MLLALVLTLFGGTTVLAVDPDRQTPAVRSALDDLRLEEPITGAQMARPSVLDASLLSATGIRQVVVRLTESSVGEVAATGASAAAQKGARAAVEAQQDAFIGVAGATVLGRADTALNAVVLEVDAAQLAALANNPNVEKISPVIDYEYALDETVPYIGAAAVQDLGVTGEGVSVAVLDSGIDYTHSAFPRTLPFIDIATSPFVDEIVWLFGEEITIGCTVTPARYCPLSNVTRAQMATFLDRAIDLPTTNTDFFTDDNGSQHEAAINRLAEAEITLGCGNGKYCPNGLVLREQMSSFLVRAFDLEPTNTDYFNDDDNRPTHEADNNALAEAGITLGCGPSKFCPTNPVTREQMAAFLFRAFGSPSAYDAAYGADTSSPENKDLPNWPIANIVGGFDFVGEVWPSGGLRPDADPIDCGGKDVNPDIDGIPVCTGGHGTHVADIIGGINGVAPDVELHAVKVCSVLTPACSGVALLLGMDYALDPNADGDTSDHVDIINMSLGSDYGQAFDDDLSLAVDTASANGVLTVAAAGNGGDKPYVSGTPAAAPTALSVAQTAVPSAVITLLEVVDPAEIAGLYEAVHQPWSAEQTAAVESLLFFDDSTNGRRLGCRLDGDDPTAPNPAGTNPFAPGELDGRIVLVDRGSCNFSEKIANIALGGGEIGLIGLVTPEDPFGGSEGDCQENACHDIPGYMIGQDINFALQDAVAAGGATVRIDPASGLDLTGTIVGSSSRGPTMLTNRIKPEIGAPGASVSAVAGSDDGTEPFSGTSGATPMVAGAAALLIDGLSDDPRSPAEIKSLLMNYAETDIFNGAPQDPINSPLAAIQRIGAGEVRVDRSLDGANLAAWDTELETGALSFGFVDADQATTELVREVTVANYGGSAQTLTITPSLRFQNDIDNGAVDVTAPASVMVPAGGTATFDVTVTIDGAALRDWTAESGAGGADPGPITLLEYDGFITLSGEGVDELHLAWHVLPRLSGETTAADDTVAFDQTWTGDPFDGLPFGSTTLNNAGVGLTAIDGYSLIGESTQLPTGEEGAGLPTIDLRYAGVQTFLVPDTFCESEFLLAFAMNTWERQTHANAPASFEWQIDTSGDGEADWAVFNADQSILSGENTLGDGRNLIAVVDIETGDGTVFFYTDHATNSGNTVFLVCGEQLGLDATAIGTANLTADLLAVDIYFTGRVTDMIEDMAFLPLGERYFPVVGADGFGGGEVPAGGSADLDIIDFGDAGTNPSELGVLLLTDGARENENEEFFKSGADQEHETIVVKPTP